MPNKDGTGPNGEGALTGRGFGNCEGAGIGRGFSRGRRSRFCWRFPLTQKEVSLSKEQEKKVLEAELAELDAEKAEIQKRLKDL